MSESGLGATSAGLYVIFLTIMRKHSETTLAITGDPITATEHADIQVSSIPAPYTPMILLAMILGMLCTACLFLGASVASAQEIRPEFKVENNVGFTYTASTPMLLETVGGQKIECQNEMKKAVGSGNINGVQFTNEILKLRIFLVGCDYVARMEPCTTAGEANSGNVVFGEGMKAEVEYINKATKEVGLIINTGGGNEFAAFTCEQKKITVKVKGSYTGVITPINTGVKTTEHFTVTFTQASGKQKPMNFQCPAMGKKEPPLMVSINGGAFEEAGISGTFELTPASEFKLLA